MQYKTVQGVRIPVLGFGTYRLVGKACTMAVESALELGYRHVDTATAYGNEADIGVALQASGVPRGEIFLTSKVWLDNLHREGVVKSAESSLADLRTDYLDLLLIHWPNPDIPLRETLGALQQLCDAGKIRRLGVSNFPAGMLARALDSAPVFCNQVEYHPLLGQEEILKLARARDLLVAAYSPLGQGAVFKEPLLREIGGKYGKTAGQIALKWLCDQPHVVAIPKALSPEHQKVNLDIFDFELSAEDRSAIDALPKDRRRVNPKGLAPDWDAP